MTTPAVIFIVLGLVTQPKIDHILIRIGISLMNVSTQGDIMDVNATKIGQIIFVLTIILGPVDLSRLFLQRIVGHLYKAETLRCSYST